MMQIEVAKVRWWLVRPKMRSWHRVGVVEHICQWGSRPWPGRFNIFISIRTDIGAREFALWSRHSEPQIGDAGQHPSGNLHGMHRSGQERLVPLSVILLDAPKVACSGGVAATVHQPWAGDAIANLRPGSKPSRKQKVLEQRSEPYAQVDCICDARQKQGSVGRCSILVLRYFRINDSFSPMTGVRIERYIVCLKPDVIQSSQRAVAFKLDGILI